jgi:phosphotriesterase-related protein
VVTGAARETLDPAMVESVVGPVPLDSLGFTLPHEHLQWGEVGCELDTVGQLSANEKLASMVALLSAAKAAGVHTVIDPTTAEMGRDFALMAAASQDTGVTVIGATGVYCRRPTPYFVERSAEELADLFATELIEGVRPTAARPAFIKLAINDESFSEHESRALDAAGIVYARLGMPVMVHTQPWVGLPVLRRLVDEHGVDGGAVVIAHAEGVFDLSYHLEIVERYGAYLGFDRFGMTLTDVRDELRLGLVTALCALGHASHVHLAHDLAGSWIGRGGALLAQRKSDMPHWRIDHVPTRIVGRLREFGVRDQDIHVMTHESPAAWLAAGKDR